MQGLFEFKIIKQKFARFCRIELVLVKHNFFERSKYMLQVPSYEPSLCDNMDGPFPPLYRVGLFNAT